MIIKKVFLIGLVAVFACSGEKKADDCTSEECMKQQAYDKVITVHDEVMPMLSRISELKEQIEEKMKQSSDSVITSEYIALMQDLDAADESMWVWMRAFNSSIEPMALDSALNYLGSEQEKVDEVARKIKESISSAEKALN